jgi:lauroyl/myristoyl acyltransferase
MVADHDVESLNGVFVPFFGRLAHTPIGPAALASAPWILARPLQRRRASPTSWGSNLNLWIAACG